MNSNDLFKNKVTYKLFAYKSYILIYNRNWHSITLKGWFAIKHQPINIHLL